MQCPKCNKPMERVVKPVQLRDVVVRSERFRCDPCKRLWAPYELWRRQKRKRARAGR